MRRLPEANRVVPRFLRCPILLSGVLPEALPRVPRTARAKMTIEEIKQSCIDLLSNDAAAFDRLLDCQAFQKLRSRESSLTLLELATKVAAGDQHITDALMLELVFLQR